MSELDFLDSLLGDKPARVLILKGPPSCGKTGANNTVRGGAVVLTLPQRCCGNLRAAARLSHPSSTSAPQVCTFVGFFCGALADTFRDYEDYGDPNLFAANLVRCMTNDSRFAGDTMGLMNAAFNTALVARAMALIGDVTQVSDAADAVASALREIIARDKLEGLPLITAAYERLARSRKPGEPYPVIIIDEANRLHLWEDRAALDQLLAFLVYLTKEQRLAHVVLATSDSFFEEVLESGTSTCCRLSTTLL